MDFKGHFPLLAGGRCHPLTLLDDHSRFCLGLEACTNERYRTVQAHLTQLFTRYGLPRTILADNGPPWGAGTTPPVHTALTSWLLRLGVRVIHGRPYHPQTQGKEERFHRTLQAEVLRDRTFLDLATCQAHFTHWRTVYNCERPHEALGDQPPVSRYQPSPRPFPAELPPIEYAPGTTVRQVQDKGGDCVARPVLSCGERLSGLSGGDPAHAGARPRDGAVLSRNHRRVGLEAAGCLILTRRPSVHHVPEHLSTMSPVYTPGKGPGGEALDSVLCG